MHLRPAVNLRSNPVSVSLIFCCLLLLVVLSKYKNFKFQKNIPKSIVDNGLLPTWHFKIQFSLCLFIGKEIMFKLGALLNTFSGIVVNLSESKWISSNAGKSNAPSSAVEISHDSISKISTSFGAENNVTFTIWIRIELKLKTPDSPASDEW